MQNMILGDNHKNEFSQKYISFFKVFRCNYQYSVEMEFWSMGLWVRKFSFSSFEISDNILRNQKFIIG